MTGVPDGQVDLHIHSRFSDGELTPAELVQRAKAMDLKAVALTDHDNIDGVAEAVEAGFADGVEVIPGVELSVAYREFKDIHLLGYYIDWCDEAIGKKLRKFQEVRESRGEKILQRINGHLKHRGIEAVDFAEVRAVARGSVGRPHIAQMLVERGLAYGINDAFDRYLVPYDVPKAYFTPAEAVEMIGAARGVIALAHPMVLTKNPSVLERLVVDLKEIGIFAVEAYYGDFTRPEISVCHQLARKHGLAITGGSDFHGERFPFRLGRLRDGGTIPYQLVRELRRAYFGRYPVFIGISGLDATLGGRLAREAALQIEAECLPDGLAAIAGGGEGCGDARHSVVAWLGEDGGDAERELKERATRHGLIVCLVRYDQDLQDANVNLTNRRTQAYQGGAPLTISLGAQQVRAEFLKIAAQRLLHTVALFL